MTVLLQINHGKMGYFYFLFLSFANIRPLRAAGQGYTKRPFGRPCPPPASALAGRYRQEKERSENARPLFADSHCIACTTFAEWVRINRRQGIAKTLTKDYICDKESQYRSLTEAIRGSLHVSKAWYNGRKYLGEQ